MDNKPQENFCRCTRMILFIRQNSPQTGDMRWAWIWTSIYGKRILNRQNYNILAGEGDILRILKEIDKAENRERVLEQEFRNYLKFLAIMEMQIELIFLKRFIHQRYLQIPMSGVQMELQLKEIIFRMWNLKNKHTGSCWGYSQYQQ